MKDYVLYLIVYCTLPFCYISLEKTKAALLSDPRLVCVPADNTPDGF